MPREKIIVKDILKFLNDLPYCKAIKIHGNQYTESGTPDIFACYRGQTMVFECKQKDEKPTKIQELRLKEWGEAGALNAVARSVDDIENVIQSIDNLCRKR